MELLRPTRIAFISTSGRPRSRPNDKLAVMVWIYGGGFTIGGTSMWAVRRHESRQEGRGPGERCLSSRRVWVHGASRAHRRAGRPLRQLRAAGPDRRLAVGKAQHRGIWRGSEPRHDLRRVGRAESRSACWRRHRWRRDCSAGAISESGGNFAPARQAGTEGGENMDSLATAEKDGTALLAKLGATSIADARKKTAEEVLKKLASRSRHRLADFRRLRAAGRSVQALRSQDATTTRPC